MTNSYPVVTPIPILRSDTKISQTINGAQNLSATSSLGACIVGKGIRLSVTKYSWKPYEPCYLKNSEVRLHLKVCGAEDIQIAANQSQQVVESDSVNCVKWGPTVSSAGAARRNHSQLPALCVPIGRAPSVSAKRVIFVRSFWFRGGYQGRHHGGGELEGARAPGAKLRGTEMGIRLRTSEVGWISEETCE